MVCLTWSKRTDWGHLLSSSLSAKHGGTSEKVLVSSKKVLANLEKVLVNYNKVLVNPNKVLEKVNMNGGLPDWSKRVECGTNSNSKQIAHETWMHY